MQLSCNGWALNHGVRVIARPKILNVNSIVLWRHLGLKYKGSFKADGAKL